MACRVVSNLKKFDRVSPSMCSLHWLKVRERIAFKIAYMVFCCTNGLAPDYLAALLPSITHNRALRSSTSGSLPSAKCRTSLASVGSFSTVGPKIWNNLPPTVRAIRSTEGFRKSFKKPTFLVSHTLRMPVNTLLYSFLLSFL